MSKAKWYYAEQKKAHDILYSLYANAPCNWQVVTEDLAISNHTCFNPQTGDGKDGDVVQVVIRKGGSQHVMIIWSMKMIASN